MTMATGGPRQGGPARHGDTLQAHEPIPSLREILGPETAEKVSAACRHTGLIFQKRQDRSSAFTLYSIARLFE